MICVYQGAGSCVSCGENCYYVKISSRDYYLDNKNCEPCPANKYRAADAGPLEPCNAICDKGINNDANGDCMKCGSGEYESPSGLCVCKKGYFPHLDGKRCTLCPTSYNATSLTHNFNLSACIDCDAGDYMFEFSMHIRESGWAEIRPRESEHYSITNSFHPCRCDDTHADTFDGGSGNRWDYYRHDTQHTCRVCGAGKHLELDSSANNTRYNTYEPGLACEEGKFWKHVYCCYKAPSMRSWGFAGNFVCVWVQNGCGTRATGYEEDLQVALLWHCCAKKVKFKSAHFFKVAHKKLKLKSAQFFQVAHFGSR